MPNGFLTTENILDTDTQLLGYPETVYYSGASGVNVDNTNLIISLTGEVGKTYTGVNPIVVNNDENLISANSAPIGVQEPLYFVQDDDEAVIIGLSGEYVTPSDITGKLDTSSFESWQQGQYTNDLTAINEKINEVSSSVPSIEGLATEQLVEETSAAIVSQIPSTAGLASETYVQEQTSAKASKSDLETVSGDIVNLIPSTAGLASEDWVESQGYLTAHQSLENYYSKDETSGAEQLAEAFNNIPQGDEAVNDVVHTYSANGTWLVADDITGLQEKGDYYSASNPSGFLVSDDISDLASISLVEDTSASITALIPTDYYPNSNPSGFITGVDLSNYYQKNETSSKEEISAAIAAIPLGDEEVNQAVHTNSATWNTVTDKLDTSSFSEVSGTFLTAHQSLDGYATETLVEETSGAITSLIPTDYYPDNNPSGFISGVDLTPYQTTAGMTAYQLKDDNLLSGTKYGTLRIDNENTHLIDTTFSALSSYNGAVVSAVPESGVSFYNSDGSIAGQSNTTSHNYNNVLAYSIKLKSWDNGLTAQINGTDYNNSYFYGSNNQTITGEFETPSTLNVKLYRSKTFQLPEIQQFDLSVPGEVNEVVDIRSVFATQDDLTAYQPTLTFGYDEQDRINSINSSALAGGGDVPEDVMVETNLEYNAVGEISGYGNSAIAQYGAEKQWLVHDDTLVHAANSAQYALGVAIDNVARLMGVDETLLFSATDSTGSTAQTITLYEPYTAFNRVRMYYSIDDGDAGMGEILTTNKYINCCTQCSQAPVGGFIMWKGERYYLVNDNQISASPSASMIYVANNTAGNTPAMKCQSYAAFRVHEIWGIGRKS